MFFLHYLFSVIRHPSSVLRPLKKVRPALGEAGRRGPGLGTGRGGDVTGCA